MRHIQLQSSSFPNKWMKCKTGILRCSPNHCFMEKKRNKGWWMASSFIGKDLMSTKSNHFRVLSFKLKRRPLAGANEKMKKKTRWMWFYIRISINMQIVRLTTVTQSENGSTACVSSIFTIEPVWPRTELNLFCTYLLMHSFWCKQEKEKKLILPPLVVYWYVSSALRVVAVVREPKPWVFNSFSIHFVRSHSHSVHFIVVMMLLVLSLSHSVESHATTLTTTSTENNVK